MKNTDLELLEAPRVEHGSLGNQIYNSLRSELMSGRFKPGERLKLRDLAQEFGVSSTPVREALLRLVSQSAVTQVDRRSVRVPIMSPARFVEITELRIHLEGSAAASATEAATAAELALLRDIHGQLTAARKRGDLRSAYVHNRRFHLTLCDVAKKPVLAGIVANLWLQCGPLLPMVVHWRPSKVPARHPHLMVLEGIASRDPALARRGMEQDIAINSEPLLRYLHSVEQGSAEPPH